ncbi:type II toxin-antitoxin system RelE/ParE family toxin [Marinifilum sp. JC120]|nr:type II toxin-antitoxin system RelE/ParE family toxin [Marinifilum sp. JC120]
MLKIRLSRSARQDLKEIWLYSATHWGEDKADSYMLEMDVKIKSLAASPGLGKKRFEIKQGYFSAQINRHLVFYFLTKNHLNILRILHEKMDVKLHLYP